MFVSQTHEQRAQSLGLTHRQRSKTRSGRNDDEGARIRSVQRIADNASAPLRNTRRHDAGTRNFDTCTQTFTGTRLLPILQSIEWIGLCRTLHCQPLRANIHVRASFGSREALQKAR